MLISNEFLYSVVVFSLLLVKLAVPNVRESLFFLLSMGKWLMAWAVGTVLSSF